MLAKTKLYAKITNNDGVSRFTRAANRRGKALEVATVYKFFAYLNRMKYINRWSLMRSTVTENIMEHSQQVAVVAHALATVSNVYFGGHLDANSIAVKALFHETSEVLTGDLPTPIKYYNAEIRDAYKALEQYSNDKLLLHLPEENRQRAQGRGTQIRQIRGQNLRVPKVHRRSQHGQCGIPSGEKVHRGGDRGFRQSGSRLLYG